VLSQKNALRAGGRREVFSNWLCEQYHSFATKSKVTNQHGNWRPPSGARCKSSARRGLVAFAGRFGKILLELVLDPVHFRRFGKLLALFGEVGPDRRIFGIDLEPFVEPGLGVGFDGLGGT